LANHHASHKNSLQKHAVFLRLQGGCEVMIDRCWLAELPDAHMHPTATGILIAGEKTPSFLSTFV
jgi:hypothetical protein